MDQSVTLSWKEKLPPAIRERVAGLLFTLVVQILLLLGLLSMAPNLLPDKFVDMVSISLSNIEDPSKQADNSEAAAAPETSPEPSDVDVPEPAIETAPTPLAPKTETTPAKPAEELPPIPLQPTPPAPAPVIAAPPTAAAPPKRAMMGPPDPRRSSANRAAYADSQLVDGKGPNGEPLYAASWYREPYEDELSGYLSTAQGPGWGLIACKTMPNYRVDHCILLDESPRGSRIGHAVLSAAWQFKVRPPRIGGREQIGEWVRIRIDYSMRPNR